MTELFEATATVESAVAGASPDAPGSKSIWFHRVNLFRRERLADRSLAAALTLVHEADAAVAEAVAVTERELHRLVGLASDADSRKALLRQARSVRRGKSIDGLASFRELGNLKLARDRQAAAVTAVMTAHPDGMSRERVALARLLTDPSLADSLAVVAPEVGQQAVRYREEVGRTGTGPARLLKSERGLLQYVLRASLRTSPLSRMTSVGLTHSAPDGTHPDTPAILEERSFFAVDRIMLDYVLGGSLAPELSDDPAIHLSLPPTSVVAGDRFLFLRPAPAGGWQRIGTALTPLLARATDLLSWGPVPVGEVVDHLLATVTDDRAGVDAFLHGAVAHGLLATVLPSTDADLVDLSSVEAPELRAGLDRVSRGLAELALDRPKERGELIGRVEDALGELSRAVGRPARIRITEDSVVSLAPIDPASWQYDLGDLGVAVDLLAAFDWLADVEVALSDAFVTRHGRGATVPLVDEAEPLVEAVTAIADGLSRSYEDDLNGAAVPGVSAALVALQRVRRRVERAIGDAISEALIGTHKEVRLTREDVDSLLNDMPERLRVRPVSYGVLVQSCAPGLVINDGLPGHGMLFSRFLGADRAMGGIAVAQLRSGLLERYGEPGCVLVEDRSHHQMNVNVHPPVLDEHLLPQHWRRLRLHHNPESNRLEILDGERRIKVLPIGGGHPGLYPAPLSVAAGLSIAGRLFNGLPDAWVRQDSRPDNVTRHVPRVRVGDVIISRARWYPGRDLVDALTEPDEAARHLAIARWRTVHSVPAEVVVKSAPRSTGPAGLVTPDAQEVRFRSKPTYIDLDSALCVRVLPRLLERRGNGDEAAEYYLEEALPGVVEGTHASEWVIEVSRPAGGRFSVGGE